MSFQRFAASYTPPARDLPPGRPTTSEKKKKKKKTSRENGKLAQPWLGDFGINTRRGLISHLAVLLGGDPIRQRLTRYGSRDAFEKALKTLGPKEAKEFKRRSARWPQMLNNLVFEPQSTR